MIDHDDLLGTGGDPAIINRSRRRKRVSRGPLHDVLTRALTASRPSDKPAA